jgi:hypothetical protein
MDRTWLTGKMTRGEMKERHILEYERLFGAEAEEEP